MGRTIVTNITAEFKDGTQWQSDKVYVMSGDKATTSLREVNGNQVVIFFHGSLMMFMCDIYTGGEE